MGVWIETPITRSGVDMVIVTPYVGVWIETTVGESALPVTPVTPYVGVWIETHRWMHCTPSARRHSLCGSVD